jgi:basic membrane protein A
MKGIAIRSNRHISPLSGSLTLSGAFMNTRRLASLMTLLVGLFAGPIAASSALLLTGLLAISTLTSCTKPNSTTAVVSPADVAPSEAAVAGPGGAVATKTAKFKVGLVLDKGGKDDKSFNSAAARGATQAVKDLGIELKDVESPDDAAFEPALRTFGERGYPLVVAIGFAQADALKKVAPQYPNTHFAIVDAVVEGPNVASLMFAEHEGSYVVGYLAGLLTKSNKIGFIGGMDIALIRRFEMGYEAGVKAANPKAVVDVNYVGINSTAWANPSRGKELALGQYGRGIDVIFHAAGASGMGVFDAAEEKKAYVIGVDSNQNGVKPGRVATSMMKRVDTAVYDVIRAQSENQFKAGTQYFGLKDKGVDYAVDENNQAIIEPFKAKLEEIRAKIVSGQIKVPDFYVESKLTK